jgi:lipopolysaccharide biosynthesis glycosyltransferase
MGKLGACYVVYGDNYAISARQSITSLLICNHLPVSVIGADIGMADNIPQPQQDNGGRLAKISLLDLSPYDDTLYIDADTVVYGDIGFGFRVLNDGYDIAIAPSKNQGQDCLIHSSPEDRELTCKSLGFIPLQLQAGVIFVRRNESTKRLFSVWRDEWRKLQDKDQGALLRAMRIAPVKLFLLSSAYNGGELIEHNHSGG